MKFIQTPLKDAYIIEPVVHKDHRGFFMESFKVNAFKDHGIDINFIQDNHAKSEAEGVLRGLHYQIPPYVQAKLIRVVRGAVYDVIVDLRKGSPTFGKTYGLELSEENFKMLLVPSGFAHGYCTIRPQTEFIYKVDAPYAPKHEGGIIWNDPNLAIDWPHKSPILSDKDKKLPLFTNIEFPFVYEEK